MKNLISIFSLTNKNAVKLSVKISVTVWGGFVIALLMNFEHPVWVMITGLISFFGNDNGQVLKKCLAQILATVVGGVIGLVVMALTMDSPLIAIISTAVIIFILSGVAINTRDMNITFFFAFSAVTLCIMTLIPVISGGTGEALITVFIDRIGTVLFGAIWVALACSLIFPVSSKNILQLELNNLRYFFGDLVKAQDYSDDSFVELNKKITFIHDLINNTEWESSYSRKYCNYTREICDRITELFVMLKVVSENTPEFLPAISDFYHRELDNSEVLNQVLDFDKYLKGSEGNATNNVEEHFYDEHVFYHCHYATALIKINELNAIYKKRVNKIDYPTLKHRFLKPFDFNNFFRNGTRSSLLFLVTYYFWYLSSWPLMFLMCIVPVVFSIMFSKLPHPDVITGMVIRGLAISIPIGFILFIITAQLPGAIEIYIIIAGLPTFFGFMGLSSLKTFAYSIGLNIGYLVTILPENNFDNLDDIPFLILRGTSIFIGAFMLRILFKLIPVVPKINHASDLENTIFYFIKKITAVKKFKVKHNGSGNYKALTDSFHAVNAAYLKAIPNVILSLSIMTDLVNNAEARINLFHEFIFGKKPMLRNSKEDGKQAVPLNSTTDNIDKFVLYYIKKYDVEYEFVIRYSDILRKKIDKYSKAVC